MLVWASRMVTAASPSEAVTTASMRMRLLIPAISTWTMPAETISLAWRACSGVIPSRHSSPLSGSAPTAPRAAAWAFPTSSLPGMPQVKAFLNIPLFSRSVICRIAPWVWRRAVAAAKAMAPGSVTPRAGFMSCRISAVNSCMGTLLSPPLPTREPRRGGRRPGSTKGK